MHLTKLQTAVTRWVITSIPLIIAVILVLEYFAVFGEYRVAYDFSTNSPQVTNFTPGSRVDDASRSNRTSESTQRIFGDPVYMTVTLPRAFDAVDMTMEYTTQSQPLTEIGVVANEDPWIVQLQPFQSQVVDQAIDEWNQVTDERGVLLLQDPESTQYASVADFEDALPVNDAAIGTYQYSPQLPTPQLPAATRAEPLVIKRSLRGAHNFVTLVDGAPLEVSATIIDLNREFNEDIVKVEVKNSDDVVVYEQYVEDDGDVVASAVVQPKREISIAVSDLPTDVYTVRFLVNNDIVMQNITTSQRYWVAKDVLNVINNEEYQSQLPNIATDETTLYFNGKFLVTRADHPTSVQTLEIDADVLPLEDLSTEYVWETPLTDTVQPVRRLVMPKNDIPLRTSGYFAFTQDSFFDPDYRVKRIDEFTRIGELNYILVQNYQPPEQGNRYLTQTATIDLSAVAYNEDHALQFILSNPAMAYHNGEIRVNEVQFTFRRASAWNRLQTAFDYVSYFLYYPTSL